MASFLIKREFELVRQEGDYADVSFVVPDVLELVAGSTAKFQVSASTGRVMISKDMTVNGQNLSAVLDPADTKGKAGKHRWELQVIIDNKPYTIGRGNFEIKPESIK